MPMMASSTSTPERDGKAAERHGVEREAHAVEHRDRPRASDSGMAVKAISAARTSRRNRYSTARMSTAAISQGLLQVAERALDEIGRTMQRRIEGDSLRFQGRRQVGQRLLDRQGGRQGVGAVLARERQHDAGLAHDERSRPTAAPAPLSPRATSRSRMGVPLRTVDHRLADGVDIGLRGRRSRAARAGRRDR